MTRQRVCWLIFLTALATPYADRGTRPGGGVTAQEPGKGLAAQEEKVYARLLKSSVWLVLRVPADPKTLRIQEGSGWVLDTKRKLIVTNQHVARKGKAWQVFFPMYAKGKPITEYAPYLPLIVQQKGIRATVIAEDATRDLAVLQLASLPKDAKAVPLAARGVARGDRVYHVGNPGGVQLWKFVPSTVLGSQRRKDRSNRKGDEDLLWDRLTIETDDPVCQGGQSGGMLVNRDGELVGVCQGHSEKDPRTALFIDREELIAFLTDKGIKAK